MKTPEYLQGYEDAMDSVIRHLRATGFPSLSVENRDRAWKEAEAIRNTIPAVHPLPRIGQEGDAVVYGWDPTDAKAEWREICSEAERVGLAQAPQKGPVMPPRPAWPGTDSGAEGGL